MLFKIISYGLIIDMNSYLSSSNFPLESMLNIFKILSDGKLPSINDFIILVTISFNYFSSILFKKFSSKKQIAWGNKDFFPND